MILITGGMGVLGLHTARHPGKARTLAPTPTWQRRTTVRLERLTRRAGQVAGAMLVAAGVLATQAVTLYVCVLNLPSTR